jgi:hypothetical protein
MAAIIGVAPLESGEVILLKFSAGTLVKSPAMVI